MSVKGLSGWHATNAKQFGQDRWRSLYAALWSPKSHAALVSPFERHADELVRRRGMQPIEGVPFCWVEHGQSNGAEGAEAAGSRQDEQGVIYWLDAASAASLFFLPLPAGPSTVLDMCAAPGGKSLVLASRIFASAAPAMAGADAEGTPDAHDHGHGHRTATTGRLVCNEHSRPRLDRLAATLRAFLPAELLDHGQCVTFTNDDAANPRQVALLAPFDGVLLDAPCTSDRHLLHSGPSGLAKWASGTPKGHADRQLRLATAALGMLKPGGHLLYSTCALSEVENDQVIERLLSRAARDPSCVQCEAVTPTQMMDMYKAHISPHTRPPDGDAQGGDCMSSTKSVGVRVCWEATRVGVVCLPDRSMGCGPLYVALVKRAK
ncbi:unnamed protein product [Vitrella brassicaformis CCMP3155]|uniref:NOL1/NOP2/Sun domain family member 4 n=1 Tax=Vitrella brassicaformis (strain CCMP3155) TaxID=1169540 RepID=A0A0G4GSN5_VITBC|nr:unnamed protein product [Vitrella brassicaformis CCMP3155]|eukprot:CEM33689.1 unnamed protein product [Vitrella brassicaformis CCMP3155]